MSDQKSASTGASSGKLGVGGEAAEGIHGAQGNRAPEENSSLEGRTSAADNASDRKGSEPLTRDVEHTPSYGGKGGAPRTSSDTREPGSRDPGTPR